MNRIRAVVILSKVARIHSRRWCLHRNMKNLFLAAGGRGDISLGSGGSDNELTNWDGTKKRNGWGR